MVVGSSTTQLRMPGTADGLVAMVLVAKVGSSAYGTAASRSHGLATNAVGAGDGLIAGDGLWALGGGTAGPWTPYPRAAPAAREITTAMTKPSQLGRPQPGGPLPG